MSDNTSTSGDVVFVSMLTGSVCHIEISDFPDIPESQDESFAEFEAEAIANGRDARLQLAEILNKAIIAHDKDIFKDAILCFAARGLLRLHKSRALSVVYNGGKTEYFVLPDIQVALDSLQLTIMHRDRLAAKKKS